MNKQKISFALGLGADVLILAAAALQTAAILTAFDRGTNYFSSSSPLPLAAALCALIGGALGVCASFLADKQLLRSSPFGASFSSLPAAVGFLLCGVCVLFSAAGSPLGLLSGIFLLLSALYSLATAFFAHDEVQKRNIAPLGAAPVLACALLNAYFYFDVTVEMNAPVKVTVQTALLFAMLYYTGELRFLLGRAMPRLYLSLAFGTLASAALCAIAFPLSFAIGLTDRLDYAGAALMMWLISVALTQRPSSGMGAGPWLGPREMGH